MKAVLLAGGLGTRFAEETDVRPKPMIEIGGKPILWHIMNTFSCHGITEFIIALGYRAESVKEYFLNFYALNNDLTLDLATGGTRIHDGRQPRWKVHLVDTGLNTQTGGRVKRIEKWLDGDSTFMLTYGDGVADVDLHALLRFHQAHGKLATVTAVRPPARFGGLVFEGTRVAEFTEKPQVGEGWINGGYFVLNREVLRYVDGDETVWEREPLERLATDGELQAYMHEGFWQPMDTVRDRKLLEELWASGSAPWKRWAD